ncbi:MAG: site-specific DNA-methyltransferase, partial [Candidatus Nanoarchaeia archaeon]|nr:site-specific DNA-methyltransferase [Candidatus Nanoarchaeia archaeon]
GHVLDKLRDLPNDCVDVVVTSTPYYGLRDYGPDCVSVWDGKAGCEHEWVTREYLMHNGRGDCQKSAKFSSQRDEGVNYPDEPKADKTCFKCGAWKGQLGLEPHPTLFIEHLTQVFSEVKRVIKPSGSLWLNLGDTYFGGQGQAGRPENWGDLEVPKLGAHAPAEFIRQRNKLRSNWLQPKQKMLMPARVAIALQDQGWILRNEIVWHKVNHMPESCRDRLTRSWESLYFFVKNDRYYFDLNAIRKPLDKQTLARVQRNYITSPKTVDNNFGADNHRRWAEKVKYDLAVGRSGNVAYTDPLHTKPNNPLGANPGDVWTLTTEGLKDEHFAAFPQKLVKRILECSAPKDGLVLDPFAGAGTSLLVAHKMGFDWLGIELVPKYCKIIEKRIERHGKVRLDKFMVSTSSEKKSISEVKT